MSELFVGRAGARSAVLCAVVVGICCSPLEASAYVGPGGGLSMLGSLLALGVAMIAAIFGFIWYPMKRLVRRMRRAPRTPDQKSEPERP